MVSKGVRLKIIKNQRGNKKDSINKPKIFIQFL